ncbi:MAG: hypothetical protein EBE86_006840 [Hormoscilla sp. GUM202]|nr:hypothetical protein [Hormoscilla sp. GM7CHS1pb]MBO1347115.1 hypothetical protein [Hormoscilla sp. GUM202]
MSIDILSDEKNILALRLVTNDRIDLFQSRGDRPILLISAMPYITRYGH